MIVDRVVYGYDICKGYPDAPADLIKVMRMQRQYKQREMDASFLHRFPDSPDDEEQGIARQTIEAASLSFADARQSVIGGLRATLNYLFDKFNLPKEGGIDVGSGSTGGMVEDLLPISDDQRRTWVQIDANPAAVAENQRRHPQSNIFPGSYHKLGLNGTQSIITGLSCLDSTAFMEVAVASIRDALKKGGYFLHLQDVKPGWSPPFQEVVLRKQKLPVKVEVAEEQSSLAHHIFPHNIMVYHCNGELVSVMELFRGRLERAIKTVGGLEVVESDWITAVHHNIADPKQARFYGSGYNMQSSNPTNQIVSTIATLARRV